MNAFNKITKNIPLDTDIVSLSTILSEIIPDKMYSYLLRKTNTHWNCLFTISAIDKYNSITYDDALSKIAKYFYNKTITGIYEQPSLDIMYEVFLPYMHKLTRQQHLQWQFLEYEDLFQMCCVSLCKLHRKNYYIHRNLLKTTYFRDVLISIRKQRTDFKLISLDTMYGKDDSLRIEDTLEDISYLKQQDTSEHVDQVLQIFAQVKDLVIDMIGERRYEQLYREYASKNTTNAGRHTMRRLKSKFNNENITMRSFID